MMPPASRGSRGSPPTAPSRIASCVGERRQVVVAQDVAGLQVVRRAERVFRGADLDLTRDGGTQHRHRLGDHLGADAVSGDHGDVKGVTHAGSPVATVRQLPEKPEIARKYRHPPVPSAYRSAPSRRFVPRSGDVASVGSAP